MNRREFQRGAGCAAIGWALSAGMKRASAAAPQAKIKIGQIGTGHSHASGKLAAIRSLSGDYELVGVVEPDERRRQASAGEAAYGGVAWLSEKELLATPGLQAVAVETTVLDLLPTATRCVAAGLNVHLDKPPGASLSGLRRLLDDATRRRVTVQLGYMLRYNPAFQLCFQAAREGWLGEIFEVHGVMSKVFGADERRRLLEYPGGSMFELGCHLIDQLVTLLGKPEQVTAYPRQTRTDLDPLVDNQLAVFEYPRATATIRSSVVEIEGGQRRQFVVCGTEGTLEIRPLEPPAVTLTLTKPQGSYRKGRQTVKLPEMTGRYDGDFIDLAAVIRGEKPLAWTPEHDLITHECVLRASSLSVDTQQ
ncbi:MAG TPA: Gfo/Idh/MocA family oxidoreductase [Pirellulales bacterium]|jgi:predicted dehydrogenase|nr:Gfo/Idh/MocA family oxidoreductase [Pirellulales bacterium]